MRVTSPTIVTAVLLGLALSCGCNQPPTRSASVSGTVLVDGELAIQGTVTFHPVEGGPPASGRILSDGTFTVRTGQGDLSDVDGGTLAPGEYKVTVVVTSDTGEAVAEEGPPEAGPRLTAAKYASVGTTDLTRTVEAGKNMFVLKLEGATTQEASEEPPADEARNDGESEAESTAPDEEASVPDSGEEETSPESEDTKEDQV